MAYIAPPTFVVGAVLTAAQMNVLGGDITFIVGTAANVAAGAVSTPSTGWTTLSGGPAVSCNTGANALVLMMASMGNATVGQASFCGIAVSGATTITAPAGTNTLDQIQQSSVGGVALGGFTFVSGLNPGSNTFTIVYQAGGGTAEFGSRAIVVVPLP